MKCLVCGAVTNLSIKECKDYEYGIRMPASVNLYRCESCGFCQPEKFPIDKDIGDFYPLDYANYDSSASFVIRLLSGLYYRGQANYTKKLLSSNDASIMDIGCSDGRYLEELSRLGFNKLYGIDVKKEIVERLIKKGFDVKLGPIISEMYSDDKFDFIRANHVIEHVTDPVKFLNICSSITKKGGYLYGETPNASSIDFTIFGKYWGCGHFPRHICIFSPKALETLAKKCGYELINIKMSSMTSGVAVGLQNILVDKLNLKTKGGRIPIYPLLLGISIPIVQLEKIFGEASIFEFLLRKV